MDYGTWAHVSKTFNLQRSLLSKMEQLTTLAVCDAICRVCKAWKTVSPLSTVRVTDDVSQPLQCHTHLCSRPFYRRKMFVFLLVLFRKLFTKLGIAYYNDTIFHNSLHGCCEPLQNDGFLGHYPFTILCTPDCLTWRLSLPARPFELCVCIYA